VRRTQMKPFRHVRIDTRIQHSKLLFRFWHHEDVVPTVEIEEVATATLASARRFLSEWRDSVPVHVSP
jgi:hypothetical protein